MTTAQILQELKEVTLVRTDGKYRVSLGKLEIAHVATSFKVYTNADGLIVLDPQVTIPAREAWLYKNKKALASLQKGLADAKAGRVRRSKEDFTKYINEK